MPPAARRSARHPARVPSPPGRGGIHAARDSHPAPMPGPVFMPPAIRISHRRPAGRRPAGGATCRPALVRDATRRVTCRARHSRRSPLRLGIHGARRGKYRARPASHAGRHPCGMRTAGGMNAARHWCGMRIAGGMNAAPTRDHGAPWVSFPVPTWPRARCGTGVHAVVAVPGTRGLPRTADVPAPALASCFDVGRVE